jgi:hypothetical protein
VERCLAGEAVVSKDRGEAGLSTAHALECVQ